MKPAYKQEWNQYVLGDAFVGMEQIPNESVDLVFTSLPDLSQTEWEKEKNESEYGSFQTKALEEFSRITKPDGFVVISQQDRMVNGHIRANHIHYANIMTGLGWKIKDSKIIIRDQVSRIDMYRFTFQQFQCFTKTGKIASTKRKGDWLKDVIVDVEPIVYGGQKTWSIPFCELVISTLTKEGDKVVDPFAAAGPVLFAANKLGRQWWGAELEEKRYCKDFHVFGPSLDEIGVWQGV